MAHEKGGVEGDIGRFRRRHLVPVPTAVSLTALNDLISAGDAVDDGRVITGKRSTVAAGVHGRGLDVDAATGDARAAEERVEAVVGAAGDEPFGLGAVAALHHPHHRRLHVVVATHGRDPTEVGERPDVPVEERLLRLGRVGDVERPPECDNRITNMWHFTCAPSIVA